MKWVPWTIRADIVLYLQDRVLAAQARYSRHFRFMECLAEEGKYEAALLAARDLVRMEARIEREKTRLHVWRTRLGILKAEERTP